MSSSGEMLHFMWKLRNNWGFYLIWDYSCGQPNTVSFIVAEEKFWGKNGHQKWIQWTKICPKPPLKKSPIFFGAANSWTSKFYI